MNTITLRRPDDWHVHFRDGAMLRQVRAVDGAAVRARDRDAEPGAAGDHGRGGAGLSRTHPRGAPAGRRVHAADDLLSDRRRRSGRNRARLRGGRLRRGKTLPGARDDALGAWRHRYRPGHAGAGADGRDRHAALDPWRGRPTPRSTSSTARPYSSSASSTRCAAACPNCASCSSMSRPRRRSPMSPPAGPNIAATITAHHLVINRNAIFAGGIRPHLYCLPIAKREKHRRALRRAATSGGRAFFLGTDSAPHAIPTKETACGCAGIFTAPAALEIYAEVFEEEGALDRFEAFASLNGPAFLPAAGQRGPDHIAARGLDRAGAGRRGRSRGHAVPRRRDAALAVAARHGHRAEAFAGSLHGEGFAMSAVMSGARERAAAFCSAIWAARADPDGADGRGVPGRAGRRGRQCRRHGRVRRADDRPRRDRGLGERVSRPEQRRVPDQSVGARPAAACAIPSTRRGCASFSGTGGRR